MNILISEDDPGVAKVMGDVVKRWQHHVETAGNGRETLRILKSRPFDMVLLDIYLPDCKGHELIPEIKTIQQNIGIVTMTGLNTRDLEQEIRQLGIFCYLIKPFRMNILKEIIDHVSKLNNKKNKCFQSHGICLDDIDQTYG